MMANGKNKAMITTLGSASGRETGSKEEEVS